MLASVGAVVATTLAGGRRGGGSENCVAGDWLPMCATVDPTVSWGDLAAPWVCTVATLAVLGAPTLLIPSRRREEGLKALAGMLLQTLVALLVCVYLGHRSLAYTVGLHAGPGILLRARVGPWFACSPLWATRYVVAWGVVAYAALCGPAVPVLEWPGREGGTTCAALAHLTGALVSGCLAEAAGWLEWLDASLAG